MVERALLNEKLMGNAGGNVYDVAGLNGVPFTAGDGGSPYLAFFFRFCIDKRAAGDEGCGTALDNKDVSFMFVNFGGAGALASGEHSVVIAVPCEFFARKRFAALRQRRAQILKLFGCVDIDVCVGCVRQASQEQAGCQCVRFHCLVTRFSVVR